MMALGPFVLEAPIGQGGLGEVWRAYHLSRGVRGPDVAVKITQPIDGNAPTHDLQLRQFANEVRAVARLSHPSIVRVFDYGELGVPLHRAQDSDEASQGGSDKTIAAGSAYLVMELATGAMDSLCGKLPWPRVLRVLMAMLDALAHAHARGVIHRDIKPSNILLVGEQQAAKLADFGIAQAFAEPQLEGEAPHRPSIQGTPAYMAPEQFSGDWRQCGPWTDLYALGCTAYALFMGRPPFGVNHNQLVFMAAHLGQTPPPLPDALGIPEEIQAWVATLLSKAPQDRFLRAADAAWALFQCCQGHPEAMEALRALPGSAPGFHRRTAPGVAVSTSEQMNEAAHTAAQGEGAMMPSLAVFQTLLGTAPYPFSPKQSSPSFPPAQPLEAPALGPASGTHWGSTQLPPWTSWERGETPVDGMLRGVGLGLFGLRDIPLVDRKPERTRLWGALGQVWQEGKVSCVIVRGGAGVGKSHLLRWLCERAHELGLATPLYGTHFPTPGHVEGVRDLVSRHLDCQGLRGEALRKCISRRCRQEGIDDPILNSSLAELLRPSSSDERREQSDPVRLSSPKERFAVLIQYLRQICTERPVILWMDDIQWGVDSLAFAQELLKQTADAPLPVLLLLSLQDEALIERPLSTRFIDSLAALPEVSSMQVLPLEQPAWSMLIREQLGLSGILADEVEVRAAGNPMFAVQLVGGWLQRGLLEPGERHFQLSPDATITLPDSLFQVWERRISRLLSVWPQETRIALELAAALGTDINHQEWEAVCALAEVKCPYRLVGEMVQQGLASTETTEQWAFAHNVFRECIERSARDAGRWSTHHSLCADALAALSPPASGRRMGRHLLHAGQPVAALAQLFASISLLLLQVEVQAAEELLLMCQKAFDEASLPPEDPRHGTFRLFHCRANNQLAQYIEAEKWANLALRDAERYGWPEVRYHALFELTRISWKQGDYKATKELFKAALAQAQELQHLKLLGQVHLEMGHWHTFLGQIDDAAEHLLEAQIAFVAIDDPFGQAKSYRHLGEVARQKGELKQAAWYAEQAKGLFATHGIREEMAQALNLHGEILRYQRDFQQAEASYRAAIRILQNTGSALITIFEINLGLTLLQQQLFHEAHVTLHHTLQSYKSQGHRVYIAIVELLTLPCLAIERRWTLWDEYLLEANDILTQASVFDVDLAEIAQLAGDLALKAGQILRSQRAFSFALTQWKALQRHEEVRILESILGSESAS